MREATIDEIDIARCALCLRTIHRSRAAGEPPMHRGCYRKAVRKQIAKETCRGKRLKQLFSEMAKGRKPRG